MSDKAGVPEMAAVFHGVRAVVDDSALDCGQKLQRIQGYYESFDEGDVLL